MPETRYEPIAIIGVGCRFPGGADSPDAFWRLLCEGRDAIVDVPPDRWDSRRYYDPDPEMPGKTYTRQGGFLREKIDRFDPWFFGISPREAESMDPQQRLLLEVTREAIEDAGLIADNLAGSKMGVFVGGFCLDNMLHQLSSMNRHLIDSHTAAGFSMTMLSNRLSHTFDFRGPSLSIDTACSSSLVTTHYACQSIWNGESDCAISGGANVMLRPDSPIVMSKGRFTSTHSRCMAFDERAEGYARGEGAGIVILKPLSRALEDRDRIYAIIRMTGVNQDGRTDGIAFPNSEAQISLMREVYEKAGIRPSEVNYVEAHGTGTQAGDIAEASALEMVLSQGRATGETCLIGSVKTNIGHLEAAAGVAGLIKASLCLKHLGIPPSLHFEQPNLEIPFGTICLRVATRMEKWPANGRPALAGVNSFGYGGTNAHVLLQAAPESNHGPDPNNDNESKPGISGNGKEKRVETDNTLGEVDAPMLFPVSARSEPALRDLAGKYAFYLGTESGTGLLCDFAQTLCSRRSHHGHRLAVVANSKDDLREKLLSFSMGENGANSIAGIVHADEKRKLVFVYSGMGPQWWGMGRVLRRREKEFRNAFDETVARFEECSNLPLLEEFEKDESDSRMGEPEVAQPANFALQVGLTALLNSWGISADAVIGHSVGEITAAYISNALTLEDAVLVCHHRSQLLQHLDGCGTMLAAGINEELAHRLLRKCEDASIAAINSPTSVTFSGNRKELETIARKLLKRRIFHRFVDVNIAYHSRHMLSIEAPFLEAIGAIENEETTIPFYSTVAGGLTGGSELGASHWWKNIHLPVLFAETIATLDADGYTHFLEVGPHPVLRHSITECLDASGIEGSTIATLNRNTGDSTSLRQTVRRLYTLGVNPNWRVLTPAGGRFIRIPTYPWQKKLLWRESERSREFRLGTDRHIFLNEEVDTPDPTWRVELNGQLFPYLKDHCIQQNIVFPGAGYVEAGLALHREVFEGSECTLEQIRFESLLTVDRKRPPILSLCFDPRLRRYNIHARTREEGAPWTVHASGRIVPGEAGDSRRKVSLDSIGRRCPNLVDPSDLYSKLGKRGIQFGKSFRGVVEIRTSRDEYLSRLDLPEVDEPSKETFLIHPTLLDSALQTVLYLMDGFDTVLPVSVERLFFYRSPPSKCWSHGKITSRRWDSIEADVVIFDEDGEVCVTVSKIVCRRIQERDEPRNWFYGYEWVKAAAIQSAQETSGRNLLVLADPIPGLESLLAILKENQIPYTTILPFPHCSAEKAGNGGKASEVSAGSESTIESLRAETFDTVIFLKGLTGGTTRLDPKTVMERTDYLHATANEFARVFPNQPVTLNVVTRGVQVITEGDKAEGLDSAPFWSIGALIENEYPSISCRLIDLDPGHCEEEWKSLATEVLGQEQDREVAFRGEERYRRRLTPVKLSDPGDRDQMVPVRPGTPVVLGPYRPR